MAPPGACRLVVPIMVSEQRSATSVPATKGEKKGDWDLWHLVFVGFFVFLGWRLVQMELWPWVRAWPQRIAHDPLWLLALLSLIGVGVWGWPRVWSWWRTRAHVREVLIPLYAGLAPLLGTPVEDKPTKWLQIPRDVDFSDPAARMRITLPDTWRGLDEARTTLVRLVSERLGVPLSATWQLSARPMGVELAPVIIPPPEVLPTQVGWEDTGDRYRVMVGRTYGDMRVVVSTLTETPHYAVGANTGGGKTTALLVPTVQARSYGTLVDMIDCKGDSYVGSLMNEDLVCDVPGVRIHTTGLQAIRCLAEFYTSMKAMAWARAAGYEGEIYDRLLVIDEFGSFMESALIWWRYNAKGKPLFLSWFHMALMQGRTKNHRLVVGTHDFSKTTFGGTNVRNLLGTKIWIGPCPPPVWVAAFGYAPRIDYDPHIPGRAVLNITGSDAVTEVQLVHLTKAEARQMALQTPPAPDWFTRGEMAPWISAEIIEDVDAEAGVAAFLPGAEEPEGDGGGGKAPEAEGAAEEGNAAGPSRPALRLVKAEAGEPGASGPMLVQGIAGAAALLGMTKTGFAKARDRAIHDGKPIPGEIRYPDNTLAWPAEALRAWHVSRPRAGKRSAGSAEPQDEAGAGEGAGKGRPSRG